MENSTRCILFPPSSCTEGSLFRSLDHFFWAPLRRRRAAGRHLGGGSRHPRRAIRGQKTHLGGTQMSFSAPGLRVQGP